MSRQRVLEFKNRLTELRNPQTEFVIWTLPTAEYSENQRKGIEFMKNMLKNSGVDIKEYDNLNCHFAVIDNDLVWYDSMNFLSREHDDDILMRIRNEEIVRELLSMVE